MEQLARLIQWALKWSAAAAIFFTLFAFALNNQQDATVHFFFGRQWQAPLVLVVLCAFAAGLVAGVLGMVPRWWKQRRVALKARPSPAAAESANPAAQAARAQPTLDIPHGI